MIIPPFAPIGHYRPAEGGWAMGCFVSTRRVFVARVCPLIRSRKPSEPGKRPFAKLQRRSGSSPRPFPTSETRGRNSKSVGTKSKSAGTKSKSGGTKSKSGGTKSKPHFLPRIQPFQWLIADFDREGNSQAASPKRASIPPTRGSSDWRSRRPWRNEPSFWRSDNETMIFLEVKNLSIAMKSPEVSGQSAHSGRSAQSSDRCFLPGRLTLGRASRVGYQRASMRRPRLSNEVGRIVIADERQADGA